MKRSKQLGLTLALLLLVLALGCEQVNDPMTLTKFQTAQNASLNGGATVGQQRDNFYPYETIYFSYSNLYPSEQTDIQIVSYKSRKVVKRLLVITDENGQIKNLPIWYNIGHVKPGQYTDQSGSYAVHLEQPGINGHPWKIFNHDFKIQNYTAPHAQALVCNAAGQFVAGQINTGAAVYLKGTKFGAGKTIQLLVVQERNNYAIGDAFTDVSGDGIESVTTDATGKFNATRIWNGAVAGAYDVVADTEPFGQFNAGDVISEPYTTGLIVQGGATPGIDLVQDIACDLSGFTKNTFDMNEAVFARVDANTTPQANWESEFVSVYITPHKETWDHGDSLVAVRTVGTHQMPIECLWNRNAGSLAVIRVRGISSSSDPWPIKLWPGNYDVIIDVDRNTVYNKGVDIIDGGSQIGFTVTGELAEHRLVASADIDLLGVYNEIPDYWGSNGPIDPTPYHIGQFKDRHRTMVWGQVISATGQPVQGAKVDFAIIKGPGFLDRTHAYTNGSGSACAVFQGKKMSWGASTEVRVTATWSEVLSDGTVKNNTLTSTVVIIMKIPHTHSQGGFHNQGIVHNQGSFSGE